MATGVAQAEPARALASPAALSLVRAGLPVSQRSDRVPDEPHLPDVDKMVATINRLYCAGTLQTAVQIGSYVIEHCFGGDPSRIRDKRKGSAAFQVLSERPDLALSTSMLWVCCAVAAQVPELPESVASVLPLSHHRALLVVVDANRKSLLASDAVSHNWSREELRAAIAQEAASTRRSAAGRKPTPRFIRAARLVHEAATLLGDDLPACADLFRVGYSETSEVMEQGLTELADLTRRFETIRNRVAGTTDAEPCD